MSLIGLLLARRSVPVQYLREPGPSQEQINLAIDAALRAPDHGHIQPWRFRLVRSHARRLFADRLMKATLRRDPTTPPAQLQKLSARADVPLMIAVSAALKHDKKVPEVEQLLSVGASVMNLLNAFNDLGFGAIWLTGPNAYDPDVAAEIGLDSGEQLIGFVYVGSTGSDLPRSQPRPAREAFIRDWTG